LLNEMARPPLSSILFMQRLSKLYMPCEVYLKT